MKEIKTRFRLSETHRRALYKEVSKGHYEQTEWGTLVKLTQVSSDNTTTIPMSVLLTSAEAKLFEDAQPNAEFEIIIKPVKSE